jgi:hypothetical protein
MNLILSVQFACGQARIHAVIIIKKPNSLFLLLNSRFLFLAVVAVKLIDYAADTNFPDRMKPSKISKSICSGRVNPDFPVLNVLLYR